MAAPSPTTLGQRVRAVYRDRSPSVRDITALAKSPSLWRVGQDRVLVGHGVTPLSDWPSTGGSPTAWRVLDRHGRALSRWVQRRDYSYVPAGRSFVGLQPRYGRTMEQYGDATKAVLVRQGKPARLQLVPGQRARRTSEIRADGGWLIDPSRMTITREDLPGCLRGSSRLDPDGRIWCLNRAKDEVRWSDDGRAWQRHRLSTSYFQWCDGGTTGADLKILGDVVTIGLLRADFSVDGGDTWWTVDLPVERVGAGVPPPHTYSEQNCADVSPLPDNRLVASYFGSIIATDASNTRFEDLTPPPPAYLAGVHEGVMMAGSHRSYGDLLASYDSGSTWRPLRAADLARRLLADSGSS